MRDTIKATQGGYTVSESKSTPNRRYVKDGNTLLIVAELRTLKDYLDEREQNEMFIKFAVFTTIKGNQYIYWGDLETGEDFITKVRSE